MVPEKLEMDSNLHEGRSGSKEDVCTVAKVQTSTQQPQSSFDGAAPLAGRRPGVGRTGLQSGGVAGDEVVALPRKLQLQVKSLPRTCNLDLLRPRSLPRTI